MFMNDFHLRLLHSGVPPTGWLHSDWAPEPTVVLTAFGFAALYVIWTGPLNRRRPGVENRPVTGRQTAYFLLGCLLYLIALSPPLDDWSDFYLLSAHMFQHMIVMSFVAPLILAGLPGWVLQPLANNRITNTIGYVLTRPIVAGPLSAAMIIAWHVPNLYNASLRNETIHITQHGFFLIASLLFWWPVIGSLPAWPRIESPPLRCVYIFFATMPLGLTGAFITLAQPGFYSFYDNVPRIFGMSLETDQQIAGLMMWVGGSVYYVLWITVIFLTWASREEAADREPRANQPVSVPAESV